MLKYNDINQINTLYKYVKLKPNIMSNVVQYSGIPEDDIDRYVNEGLFTIYHHVGFEYIKPEPYIELFLSEHTVEHVNKNVAEKKKSFERIKRINHIDDYIRERDPWLGSKLRNHGQRYICPECLKVNVPCDCNVDTKRLCPTAKLPRKNASKKKWKDFRNHFNI